MNKLLSAGFARLWKSKLFWACAIFNLGLAIWFCCDLSYYNTTYNQVTKLDSIFYQYLISMMVIIPMFTAIFIGTEYSNGTVRNKFIVGHSRLSVYMSNLIVCCTANLLITAAFIFGCLVFGIPLLGFFSAPIKDTAFLIFSSFLTVIALTALITAVAMLLQNKAASAVTSIIAVLVLFLSASVIDQKLHEPELQASYIALDENGEFKVGDPEPNPLYVGGTTRDILEFFDDFLPTGQAIQMSNFNIERSARWWYLSLIFAAASTGIGFTLFHKKDLR